MSKALKKKKDKVSPYKEFGQESAVLLDATFPPTVRKIENDAVVDTAPNDLMLI